MIYLGIVGAICVLGTQLVKAQSAEPPITITKILQLSDIPRPYTNVKDWLAQQNQQTEVTALTFHQCSTTKLIGI